MAKYLVIASYTAEGMKGVVDKGGTSRREAVEKTVADLGGTLDSFYFAFGEDDAFVTLDLPDNVSAAAVGMAVGATGMVDMDGYGKIHSAVDGKPWEMIWEQPTIDYINKPLAPERLEAFYTQVQDFIDSVRLKRPPAVTGKDGRAAVELIDACRRSSATGQAVELPLRK